MKKSMGGKQIKIMLCNIIATTLQRQRTLHCMAPAFTSGNISLLYQPAENHLGFSPWPFYEQNCRAGHSMAQAQIQLGGRGVCQGGMCARFCLCAA